MASPSPDPIQLAAVSSAKLWQPTALTSYPGSLLRQAALAGQMSEKTILPHRKPETGS